MNFKITNGVNLISVAILGLGSYFRLRYPAAVVWDDCRGTIGQYLSLIPVDEQDRKLLQDKINNSLFEDYTKRELELHKLLEPLFNLFSNGNYNLYFRNSDYVEKAVVYSGNQSKTYTPSWYIVYPQMIEADAAALKIKEHKAYLNTRNLREYNIDIIETTTTGLYEAKNNFYVATKPLKQISKERVKYFEEEISKGRRPFAILIKAIIYGNDEYSDCFILDGHHKLQAYQNLNIQPALAIITKIYSCKEDAEFDFDELAKRMYPWQIEHIVKNWDNEDGPQPKHLLPKISLTGRVKRNIDFVVNSSQSKIKNTIEEFNYWKQSTWLSRAKLFRNIQSAVFIVILLIVILGIISSL